MFSSINCIKLLLIIKLQLIIAQTIVWDDYYDLCKWTDKRSQRLSNRCELSSNILVEKRLYRSEEPFWCIIINNTNSEYNKISIEFNGSKMFRHIDYHIYKNITKKLYSSNENVEKFQIELENNFKKFIISPSDRSYELQKIVSIKLNEDLEMCDTLKFNETDLIYENQENTNLLRFFKKCHFVESRLHRPPGKCELLDEIVVEEFSLRGEERFHCVLVNLPYGDKYIDDGRNYDIEFIFSDQNSRASVTRKTISFRVDSDRDIRKYRLTQNRTIFAFSPLNQPNVSNILSIKLNEIESCQKRISSHVQFLPCGLRKIKHRPLITFGLPSYHGQFPWHTAIYELTNFGETKYICGGTIIAMNAILTAAHCVKNEHGIKSPNILRVQVGKYDLTVFNADTREYRVIEIFAHPEFEKDFLENDIAIIKLQNAIIYTNFIQPICLTSNLNYFEQTTNIGIVAGWGKNEKGEKSNFLNYASMPIVTDQICRRSKRNFFSNFLNENNFCAGYRNGTSVCTGDSGGGLIFEFENGWYLRGIVSLGVAAEFEGDFSEFVLFTDVTKYFDWIYTILNN